MFCHDDFWLGEPHYIVSDDSAFVPVSVFSYVPLLRPPPHVATMNAHVLAERYDPLFSAEHGSRRGRC